MKLDVTMLRYIGKDEFRALAAIEQLMKNHDLVPTEMIPVIARMKPSLLHRSLKEIHKHKLIYHEQKKYDGYRLTFAGYDFLSLKALVNKGIVASVGTQIGIGKESDIFNAMSFDEEPIVIKLHRLGRVSFRTVKNNRDYLQHRKHASWLYLSRLSALKEYAFMKALYDEGFPCPRPIQVNRHIVVMELINAKPLHRVKKLKDPAAVYGQCMELIVRLAAHGLIHCDFNEFNLLIDADENVIVIDFPQVVSIDHENAKQYFDRDVNCIRTFFSKKHRFEGSEWPEFDDDVLRAGVRLDDKAQASGYDKKAAKTLEAILDKQRNQEELDEELSNDNDDDDESASISDHEGLSDDDDDVEDK
eukprot:CAMPEP_0168594510 /NCGR_PEP_ID=MMETSP0420-20121227/8938_1 /TAXON_ID=498008 /ORGANISM="Pessonella sp." /LENGTH=359 /DNA_ID=CAMNT_0008630837 /DNA_START=18 /DNA_END=1097 /DNA_ORIENTATION=-